MVNAVPRIQEIAIQGNYDLVHVHTPVAAFVTRYAISRLKIKQKPKVIYTAHGFHFHSQGNPLTNFIFLNLEKLAGSWTDYLITINREDEAAARKHHLLSDERIFYTPGIGLELEKYDCQGVKQAQIDGIRQELELKPQDILLLTVAEFTPNKRHGDQLLALKQLDRPNVHLALAGDGDTRTEAEQLAEKLNLQQQVHFLGFRYDIPALICASHAVLLTSQREGLPRSIMEAFCGATPVIGTKVRGIQDLLADDCGLLVDVGDTVALTQAIAQLIDSPLQAVDPNETEFAQELVERFHQFLQTKVVGENKTYPIKLKPEEAVFFHDDRLIHGRNSFEATKDSERFFWKSALKLKPQAN